MYVSVWACTWGQMHTEPRRHWVTHTWIFGQLWSTQCGNWEPNGSSKRTASGLNPWDILLAPSSAYLGLCQSPVPLPILSCWEVAPRIPFVLNRRFGFRCSNQDDSYLTLGKKTRLTWQLEGALVVLLLLPLTLPRKNALSVVQNT